MIGCADWLGGAGRNSQASSLAMVPAHDIGGGGIGGCDCRGHSRRVGGDGGRREWMGCLLMSANFGVFTMIIMLRPWHVRHHDLQGNKQTTECLGPASAPGP